MWRVLRSDTRKVLAQIKEKVMGARCVKVAEFKCHKDAVNFCRAWGWAFVVNCNRVAADPNKCRFVVVCEQ